MITLLEGKASKVGYAIVCDAQWRMKNVQVSLMSEGKTSSLELRTNNQKHWWTGQKKVAMLRGYTDIDLGVTPATNTLPLQRLQLAEGQSAEVTAAWVRFPGLELQPLVQKYTRLGRTTYLYESRGGSYQSQLEVDEYGLVVNYANSWTRLSYV